MNEYTGHDMWREYVAQYGADEAKMICNRYLDMQARISPTENPEEHQFCCELYQAMKEDLKC